MQNSFLLAQAPSNNQLWIAMALGATILMGVFVFNAYRTIQKWLDTNYPTLTIYSWQKAVRYDFGKLTGLVEPGQFRYRKSKTTIRPFDVREQVLNIQGQEILSSDALGFKLSLLCNWKIVDLLKAVSVVESYQARLYADIQSSVRQTVQSMTSEEIMADRGEIARKVEESIRSQASRYGVEVISVSVRDLMLPGPLKQVFSKVAEAKQEGRAALERARAESAALRNLANAARTLQNTPGLSLLRLIQTVEATGGNKLVLDLSELTKKQGETTSEDDQP